MMSCKQMARHCLSEESVSVAELLKGGFTCRLTSPPFSFRFGFQQIANQIVHLPVDHMFVNNWDVYSSELFVDESSNSLLQCR